MRTATKPVVVETLLTNQNQVDFSYRDLEQAFPVVDCGLVPFGTVGVFQIRQPKDVTAGGVLLPTEALKDQHYNTQIARVVALGPLAFKTERDGVLAEWPEGPWFGIGDFVRVAKYGGDRFTVPHSFETVRAGQKVTVRTEVVFALFKVKDVLGRISADPLKVKAFLD